MDDGTALPGGGRGDDRHGGRRRWAWVAAAVVVLLVVAGVVVLARGGDDGGDETGGPADEPSVLPLLGTRGDPPDRPALAAKLENTAGGRPQTGVADADVVVEEVVEGGLTRLLAVFHSEDPPTVGPVRSARSTDIALLAELGRPLFAWSGANPTFAAAVRAADIVDVGLAAAPEAYERVEDRRAPYDLYADTAALRAAGDAAGADDDPPPALFTYRAEGEDVDVAGSEPAAAYTTAGTFGLATEVRWDWDPGSGTWLRTQDGTPHVDDDGTRVAAANVVVRFTPYRDTGIRDVRGAVVPEATTVGEGDAWLLTGGRVLRGSWHKPAAEAPTSYTDVTGAPLLLTPGRTWVELFPPETGRVLAQ